MMAAVELIVLSENSECSICGSPIPAGSRAFWDSEKETATCRDCNRSAPQTTFPDEDLSGPVLGIAGDSSGRAFERRHDAAGAKNRKKRGKLAHVVNAPREDPQSTKEWAQGEKGEQSAARRLNERAGDDFIVLHDRTIPSSRANIDHIVVASSGVYVIDAKRYKGKRVELRQVGPLFARESHLFVGGRDKMKLVEDLLPQLARVRKVLDSHKYGHLPVQGFLCFVEADWQLPATPLRFGSVRVVWPRELIKAIDSEQSEEPLLVHPVAQALAQAFPER
jgi:hypothetical protein